MFGATAFIYLIIATLVLPTHWAVARNRKHFDRPADPSRRRALNAAGNLALAAPFAVIGYGTFIQRTDFHVREVDIPIPTAAGSGRAAHSATERHPPERLPERGELARVIDASLGLRPHLAVITGDLISGPGDPLDACIRQLARVKADAGVYGCMGNHERYSQVEDYTRAPVRALGIRFLRGEAQPLKFGDAMLNLAGMDYQSHRTGSGILRMRRS